ncbi:hypothetical protein VP01_715g4 [Puccinia sorghi]|uniref:Uncharacterized protein n=1 Tax=Puccinia sorghi TaxID=27349 RepID=A0A0L6UDE4_9BASI|nr:hypothetical protein VP01_715g4 [Puccinia sorghi]
MYVFSCHLREMNILENTFYIFVEISTLSLILIVPCFPFVDLTDIIIIIINLLCVFSDLILVVMNPEHESVFLILYNLSCPTSKSSISYYIFRLATGNLIICFFYLLFPQFLEPINSLLSFLPPLNLLHPCQSTTSSSETQKLNMQKEQLTYYDQIGRGLPAVWQHVPKQRFKTLYPAQTGKDTSQSWLLQHNKPRKGLKGLNTGILDKFKFLKKSELFSSTCFQKERTLKFIIYNLLNIPLNKTQPLGALREIFFILSFIFLLFFYLSQYHWIPSQTPYPVFQTCPQENNSPIFGPFFSSCSQKDLSLASRRLKNFLSKLTIPRKICEESFVILVQSNHLLWNLS